jgi:hypothetical protein
MGQVQSLIKCDRGDACPDQYLDVPEHWNYCPNGLQGEGRAYDGSSSTSSERGTAEAHVDVTKLGVDRNFSGEGSEQTVGLARKSGEAFPAAGHNATERFGARTPGHHLARRFIDILKPV